MIRVRETPIAEGEIERQMQDTRCPAGVQVAFGWCPPTSGSIEHGADQHWYRYPEIHRIGVSLRK